MTSTHCLHHINKDLPEVALGCFDVYLLCQYAVLSLRNALHDAPPGRGLATSRQENVPVHLCRVDKQLREADLGVRV